MKLELAKYCEAGRAGHARTTPDPRAALAKLA